MQYFDLAQSFIEQCGRAENVEEIASSFGRTIQALGFKYFACGSHVDPLNPPQRAVVLHTYPSDWVRTYSERRLFDVDPVFRHANRTALPFYWDESAFRTGLTRPQREILEQATQYGIAHGYTIPIHLPWSRSDFRASCSVVPDSPSLDVRSYHCVQLMAGYFYDAARGGAAADEIAAPTCEISLRERQCLELVAQGKSDWVAGKLLNLSESTVHNHIENAKRRLGVSTRAQAIVHALASRQISIGDVINPPSQGRRRRASV